MIRQILSAEGGVVREIYVDDHKAEGLHDIIGINTRQDCDPVLREVRLAKDMHGGEGAEGMKLAARIPVAFVDRMMRDGSWNDPDALRKLLNDPELRAFRCWEGRV